MKVPSSKKQAASQYLSFYMLLLFTPINSTSYVVYKRGCKIVLNWYSDVDFSECKIRILHIHVHHEER